MDFKSIFAVLLLTLFSLESNGQSPNVIFILTDDQGYADAGCYGSDDLLTPNIDRLAKTGVRFTQFYASAPICSPSRASIMTGKTPIHAGVPGNAGASASSRRGLPSEEITMAEIFGKNGYRTAAIGKWHLGYTPEMQPNNQGFDYHFGHLVGCIDNYSHFYYWNGPNRHDLHRNGEEIFRDGEYFPEMCLQEAFNFIDENKDHPFFIYYAMNNPHYPYQGHKKWLEYYNNKEIEYPRNLYNAFVSTLDEYIGKLVDKIESESLRNNTIIVFQSDHGHSTEERAHFGGGSAGPFRGAKGSLYEGGLRVPAIISWVGVLPENESRDQWLNATDWLPTLVDLCGFSELAHAIDGVNFTEILRDPSAEDIHSEWHWNFSTQWSVRRDGWKLLYDPQDTSNGREAPPNKEQDMYFLVNLEADPGERTNLIMANPELAEELKALYVRRSSR